MLSKKASNNTNKFDVATQERIRLCIKLLKKGDEKDTELLIERSKKAFNQLFES